MGYTQGHRLCCMGRVDTSADRNGRCSVGNGHDVGVRTAMKKKQEKLYMPYCIVNYLHWEATGRTLYCDKCPIADRCEKYRIAKEFRKIT